MPTAECEPTKGQDTEGADSAYMHEDNLFTTPLYTESLKCSAVFNSLPEHISPFSTAAIKIFKLMSQEIYRKGSACEYIMVSSLQMSGRR